MEEHDVHYDEDIQPAEMRRPKLNKKVFDVIRLKSWQDSDEIGLPLNEVQSIQIPLQVEKEKPSHPLEEDEEDDDEEDEDSIEEKEVKVTPGEPKFTVSKALNRKIFLWVGNIATLNVDGVVNPTNESMTSKHGVSGAILDAAGHEIYNELMSTESCKTGEARLSKGFRLPAPWIIHTVGPKYNIEYNTAAENALHQCYRSVLEVAFENNIRSLAIPPIHSARREYPIENGAHIALRTIRRFLENWDQVDRVVLVFDNEEERHIYANKMVLYFPRTVEEMDYSMKHLPEDIGNEFGETYIEERKIRIHAFPFSGETESRNVVYESQVEEKLPSNLTVMTVDQDMERMRWVQQNYTEQERAINELYLKYLALSFQTDLSDMEQSGVFYQSGHDSRGRPIMVLIGMRLPETHLLEKFLLYYIKVMDIIANRPYNLIYVHTHMSKKSKPELSWLKKVYEIMDSKYGDHLHSVYVLHPTFWLKVLKSMASVFMGKSNKVLSKIAYIDGLGDLYDAISTDAIQLPEEVIQFDLTMNGPISTTQKEKKTVDGL